MANSQGPMARRVADLRLAFALLGARNAGDPRWVPAPLAGPPVAGRIRVAAVRDPAGDVPRLPPAGSSGRLPLVGHGGDYRTAGSRPDKDVVMS